MELELKQSRFIKAKPCSGLAMLVMQVGTHMSNGMDKMDDTFLMTKDQWIVYRDEVNKMLKIQSLR